MLTKPRSSHTDFINKIREDLSMNRENKRKQYQNGYYKNHRCDDTFTCKHCGRVVVPVGAGTQHRNLSLMHI